MTFSSSYLFFCYWFFIFSLGINSLKLLCFHNIFMHFLCISFFLLHILCMCVHGFISFLIDLIFFHISLCLCSSSFTFSFEHIYIYIYIYIYISQVTGVLSIINPTAPPFQKVCGNCHVADVIISTIGGVYCNACCSKSMAPNLSFPHGSLVTNDEHVLLTIWGKWLETIVHMIESKFLGFASSKTSSTLHFNSHSW
jgi:hypothetical protein